MFSFKFLAVPLKSSLAAYFHLFEASHFWFDGSKFFPLRTLSSFKRLFKSFRYLCCPNISFTMSLLHHPLTLLVLAFLSPLPTLSCTTDLNCSLNGLCVSSNCVCDPGWIGSTCGILDLRPATRGTGYNHTILPSNAPGIYNPTSNAGNSSWCGSIVHDASNPKLFHMFASQFTHGCGLSDWKPFSSIIRAESVSGPAGPYVWAEEVVRTWAHNPVVTYSPAEQLYLLYYIGSPMTVPGACKATKIGDNITISTSTDLRTWKEYKQVITGETNPAPLPLWSASNHTSEILMAGGAGLGVNMYSAPSYMGPYKRVPTNPLFANPNEDPCLWKDKRGNYHLLMHDLAEIEATGIKGAKVGSHAFARSWEGPWTFDNVTLAYNTTVKFTDGSEVAYYRRERPKVWFSEDGSMTPLFLVNGVQEKSKKGSYTLVQPIGSGAAEYEKKMGFT